MSNFSIVIFVIIIFVFILRICIYFYKKHRYFTLKTREKIIYKLNGSNLQEFLNNEKGLAYEYNVGKFYENLGYKVTFNGIEKGINDGGIDLIAYKKDEKSNHELILIQCKNYINSNILTQDNVRKFLGDCYLYLYSKNLLSNKNYSFRHIYVLSNELDSSSNILRYEKYCQNKKFNLEIKTIPYNEDILNNESLEEILELKLYVNYKDIIAKF